MRQRIFNLIILDESGSMQSIKPQAVSGVNETLQTIKGAQQQFEEQEHLVTFVSFSAMAWSGGKESVKMHYKCTPVELVKEITDSDYTPHGGTPLYDAMGVSLTQLRNLVKKEDKVLVTVVTDGYENASHEYDGKDISKLVGELRELGWVFTYIGANQDVDKVADEMGIKHRLAFSADMQGTKAMFEKECLSRKRYYQKVSEQQFNDEDEYFFERNNPAQEEKQGNNDKTKRRRGL